MPVDINGAGGVIATFCQMNELGDGDAPVIENEDLTVETVTEIVVIELGQDFQILNSTTVFSIEGGDVFTPDMEVDFESIISYKELSHFDDSTNIPKVLQVNIFGENPSGNQIINFFAISFTNQCDAYEVVDDTSTAGWVDFVSMIQLKRVLN